MNKTLQKHVYVNIYIYIYIPFHIRIRLFFFVITPPQKKKKQQHRWSKVSCIIQRESLQDDDRKDISPKSYPQTQTLTKHQWWLILINGDLMMVNDD